MSRFDEFTEVSSDHIRAVKYHQLEHKMTVRFENGSEYNVHGIGPEQYQKFMAAPSKGQHYHENIKNEYPIERVK